MLQTKPVDRPVTSSILEIVCARGVREAVAGLTDEEAIRITGLYGAHNYQPLPVNIVRAKGIYAYDGAGREYIDCIGCYSALAHGHLSGPLVQAVKEQLDVLTLTGRAVYTSETALFLRALCEYTETEMACPMNTGAEAVETAIKLARKWAYMVKGVPEGRAEIIAAEGNFHGRTTTIVGFSSHQQYRDGFGPFTPGFRLVPGNVEALSSAIKPETAALLLEPIQAEGGINIPPRGFMAEVRRACSENNVLLIWDEIQTGFCRTGRRFAWQHEDAKPDLMCVGKPLGGGIYPVSAVVGRADVLGVFEPGDHGSTFGGNPLASVVALAAMAELEAKNLCENSARMGAHLLEGMRSLKHACIEDVRGRGLLVGLEVREGTDTRALSDAFLACGILTKEARSRTFRFAPPLIVDRRATAEIVERTSQALSAVS